MNIKIWEPRTIEIPDSRLLELAEANRQRWEAEAGAPSFLMDLIRQAAISKVIARDLHAEFYVSQDEHPEQELSDTHLRAIIQDGKKQTR